MSKNKKEYPIIYKTKNLSLSKVKNYSFTLELDQPLLKKHLKALGMTEQSDYCYKIEGEFTVDFDDDIAMPQIESLYLISPIDDKKYIELDLNRCFNHKCLLIDGYTIQDWLADKDDGSWLSDKAAAHGDWLYDCWKDSQLEG